MRVKLHTQIFISILLGLLVGFVLKEHARYLQVFGDIFIRLLRMVIVPLVFASLVMGVVSLGNIRSLGKLGAKTIAFFLVTTIFATLIGLILVNLFQPGANQLIQFQLTDIPQHLNHATLPLKIVLLDIIPSNIFQAMISESLLGVIFFAIAFGCALIVLGSRSEPIVSALASLNDVMLKLTEWIMLLAPLGVFSLMAALIGRTGFGAIKTLALYMFVVILGLAIHMFVVLLGFVALFAQLRPVRFFKQMFPAIATAFSTDSSIATLPVTMDCMERQVGISRKITGFVAPLGATLNMNGTALYLVVAAMFIAQVYHIPISFTQQIMILITAILAAVGTAGIPSASLIMMAIVLNTVNVPLEGIGLILAVDRILDMFRTVVNVFGDAICAAIIARSEGEELN